MSKTTIVAFDPGGTTGIFEVSINSAGESRGSALQLGPEPHHIALLDHLDRLNGDCDKLIVVFETFEYRNTSRVGLVLDSVEYIGLIKTWCQQNDVQCFAQSPSMAKGFASDKILKEIGIYSTNFRHANDAARHMVYFIVNNKEFNAKAKPYERKLRDLFLQTGYK